MASVSEITYRQRENQLTIARELQGHGYSLKALSASSGIPYNTLRSYFPGERDAEPALMPVTALYMLAGVIPDELLSLLLPDGRRVVELPEEIDHDDLCAAMQDYLLAKSQAHHPDSPDGREISPCEDAELRGKVARLKAHP